MIIIINKVNYIRHQLDLMLLVGQLHRELGLTVVMVLHDLLAT